MCYTTTTTHLVCLHTTSSTTKCTAASGYLIPGFFSFLFHTPKCNHTSNKEYTEAFCPTCISLLNQLSVNEKETRARVLKYRERIEYFRPITMFADDERGVDFREEGDPGNGKEKKAQKSNGNEEESQNYLDAWWGSSLESESATTPSNKKAKSNECEFHGVLNDTSKPLSRRSSTLSTCTLWPGPEPPSSQADANTNALPSPSPFTFTSTRNARKSSEADIGAQRLDTFGLVELDEYGEETRLGIPPPAFLARDRGKWDGYAFEMRNFEEELPGPTNWEGFEWQQVKGARPPQPFPKEDPQRKEDGGGKKLV
jgi:hypothetical protein